MDVLTEYLTKRKESLISAKQRFSVIMTFAWDAYSKPCPLNAAEMVTLIFLCVFVSLAISSLVFMWMVFSLDYLHSEAAIVTGVCACVILVLLILVHPVRCVITVAVPSLGTKQGRKILLSMALLYAISTCVPNMIYNLTTSLYMLKCGVGNVTQSVLKSNEQLKTSLDEVLNFVKGLPSFQNTDYLVEVDNKADLKGMEKNLSTLSESMRDELALLHNIMNQISKIVKKLLAALFMVLMISSSVAYVKGYLTHIKYDNVYRSHQLMTTLQSISRDDTLPDSYKKKLVKTSGVRMSIRELEHCIWGLLNLLFYAVMCGMMLGLDHLVHWTQLFLLEWASDIPEIHGHIEIHMTSTTQVLFNNHQYSQIVNKQYTVPMLPQGCIHSLSVPQRSTLNSICLFLAIGFFMLLVEIFARRLRRKVCASFYRSHEEHLIQFLCLKIIEKRSSGQ